MLFYGQVKGKVRPDMAPIITHIDAIDDVLRIRVNGINQCPLCLSILARAHVVATHNDAHITVVSGGLL